MDQRGRGKAHPFGRLARYRALPYERLAAVIESVEVREVPGTAGTLYQLEFQFHWDDKAAGDIRVTAAMMTEDSE
jgi:hypothetical protein